MSHSTSLHNTAAINGLRTAAEEAKRQRGWYAGTLAERHDFIRALGRPAEMTALDYARVMERAEREDPAGPLIALLYDDDPPALAFPGHHRLTDGPGLPAAPRPVARRIVLNRQQCHDLKVWRSVCGLALCIPDGPGRWLFCGLAAS